MVFIKFLLRASAFYVIIRILLTLFLMANKISLFDNSLLTSTYYHPYDGLSWYVIFMIAPIFLSIILSLIIRLKYFIQIGLLLLPFLIIYPLYGAKQNKEYWGYVFKRPTVFDEVKDAKQIISINSVKKSFSENKFKLYTDSNLTKTLSGRTDHYYHTFDRTLLTFESNSKLYPQLSNWYEIAKDSNLKISKNKLERLSNLIIKPDLLVKPNIGYEERAGRMRGKIIEFQAVDNNNYILASLTSGEVENDHYPNYEILFSESSNQPIISKSQLFFTDIAGAEGFELSNMSFVYEAYAFIVMNILILIYRGARKIKNIF